MSLITLDLEEELNELEFKEISLQSCVPTRIQNLEGANLRNADMLENNNK